MQIVLGFLLYLLCISYHLHIGCISVVIWVLNITVWMLWLQTDLQKCIKLTVIAFFHCSINTPLSANAFDVNGHIRKQRTRESVRINLGEEFLAAVLPKAFWLTQLIAAAHCKIGNRWRSSRHTFKKERVHIRQIPNINAKNFKYKVPWKHNRIFESHFYSDSISIQHAVFYATIDCSTAQTYAHKKKSSPADKRNI